MPEETQPRTVADAPPVCDQKNGQAPCKEPAVFSYMWDWGEKGVCCQAHQFLLTQTSGNLGRAVNFAPLQAAAPAPITRDERARLAGQIYAAEAEIEDLKGRGLDLYRENEKLARQLQTLTVRHRELELQHRDLTNESLKLQEKMDERDSEHGNLVDELERLRSLQSFSEKTAREAASERGLSHPSE